ncbi:MAG: class I SAM-dependent methyltransferase [Bacteroidia bacterium]|nr:class I SAM-dependent methyltransferase [Bacteroidia bacterium]
MNAAELQRLREVYDAYRLDARKQRSWSSANAGNRAMGMERDGALRELLAATQGASPAPVLDIGCGAGNVLATLHTMGLPQEILYGVDIDAVRIHQAHERYPAMHYALAEGSRLPLGDGSVHTVLLFTVLSSILVYKTRSAIAREALRVLRPQGSIIVYDFRYNNPRNPFVRALNLQEIRALFPGTRLECKTLTLLPPLARSLGRLTNALYPVLARIPFLKSHHLCSIRPL